MVQFCTAATRPPGRYSWSIIAPPLTLVGAYVGRTWTRSDFFGATTVGAGPNGGANWDARTHGHFTGAPLTQAQAASMCGRGDGRNTVYLGFR